MEKNQTWIITIAVLAVILFVGLQALPELGVEKQKPAPEFNIGEYSATISSEKPDVIMASFAEEESTEKEGTELTVYNQNLALVKEMRTLSLEKGLNLVKYTDIAEQIKADTVFFEDLDYPDTFVVEQNYEYDIVSQSKLLDKYVDEEITVKTKDDQLYTGKLLSHSSSQGLNQLLLDTGEQVIALNEVQEIYFPELTDGLLTKPSLVWKLYTENAGDHATQTTYMTTGMTWEADYIAKINESDDELNFTGWVTINNTSGTSYPNTSLKLVAGDLHITQEQKTYRAGGYDIEEMAMPTASPNQFTEETMFEYHMYSLERQTDVQNNETKQISLLSAPGVSIQKKFVFDPQRSYWWSSADSSKVQVRLDFENSEEDGLGMPLPKGTVRVYKEDSQGKLQFVGEDNIDHTPKDEEMSLLTGYAFDVIAEKTTVNQENIGKRCRQYSYEVELRNHKEKAITVYVIENASGDNEILKTSHTPEKKSAYKYEFAVSVPADGETTLSYTVQTCW